MIMYQKIHLYFLGILFSSLLLASPAVLARDVSLANNQLLLTPNHGGDGSAWGKPSCSACHVRRNIHKTAPKIRDIVLQVGETSCAGCHGQNGTTIKRQCILCHNNQLLPKKPIMEQIKNHNFTVLTDSSLTDEQCVACHSASDMDGQFEPAIDLTHYPAQSGIDLPYRNQTEFCLRCHNLKQQQPGYKIAARFTRDPLVMMAINYHYIDKHGYPEGSGERTYAGLRESDYTYGMLVECTSCHAMHGTHNEKLIIDRSDAGAFLLNRSLRERPVYVHVEKGNYSQLCVLCHQSKINVEQVAENTGNGLNGVHQISGSCLDCHTHGMAVQTGL